MKFTKLFTLLLFLFCAPLFAAAQTTCPSGSTIARGFRTVNPADSTINRPICIEQTTGRYILQIGNLNLLSGHTLIFEGATADAFELTLTVADVTADRTVTFADVGGTVFLSTLATNAPEIANSVFGTSNNLAFEGATADAFEAFITATDPTADSTHTLPDASQTVGEVFVQFVQGGTAGDALDTIFFIAGRAFTVTRIDAVWGTAESTGSMDIQVERLQGTEACTGGAGDDLLSAVIDATTTANTVGNGSLTATSALLDLAAGDRLCLNLTATPNEVVNMVVTVTMIPN